MAFNIARPKVVLCRNFGPDVMPLLETKSDVDLVLWEHDRPCEREWLLANAPGAEVIIVLVTDKVDAELLDIAGPQLKAISTMSVGYEHVDVGELKKRGIRLGYTPDVLTDAVADISVMLAIMAGRNVKQTMEVVQEGKWPEFSWAPFLFCGPQFSASTTAKHRTAGFIGFGRIAQATLARLVPFGFKNVIYYSNPSSFNTPSSVSRDEHLIKTLHIDCLKRTVDLLEVAAESDVVFVLAPGGPETMNLVDEAFLKGMKKNAVLVNASRGTLVDSKALVRALREGWIWGAGLDVVAGEPHITKDHPLVKEPKCVILPHIGSATLETRLDMATLAVKNANAFLAGDRMMYEVESLLPGA